MKRLLLSIFLLAILLPSFSWAATTFNDTTADHKWSTAGNWSDGKPDAADAVTVAAGVTSIIIDEAAACLSFDTTAAVGAVTVSGTGTLSVAGNFTLEAGGAWTATGTITFTANATVTTAAVTLASAITVTGDGITVTLADALNIGTKTLTVTQGTLASGNFAITCGSFSTSGTGVKVLTLGSSTITCIKMDCQGSNLTVTANTATVNATCTGTDLNYFGAATWGGTVTITVPDSKIGFIRDANTFENLTIVFNPNASYIGLGLNANQTVTGTFTVTGNTGATGANIRGMLYGNDVNNLPGTRRTITAAAVSITGTVDFRDIGGAGAGSWDLSAINSGNLGNNSGITFRAPATYYLCCGANDSRQDYHDVWSVADDGTPDGAAVFPLPQDAIIVNNNTWSDAGNAFYFHSGGKTGDIDASALTEANTLAIPRGIYGDVIYTGSGITIPAGYSVDKIDGGLKNDGADTLDINITPSAANTAFPIISGGGTIKLLSAITTTGNLTLTKGTLNLNGQTLTVGSLLSTVDNTRQIQDGAGGGKIVLNSVTGTIFDLAATSTNLTIANAPDIQIGDGTKTLTGNVTFEGGAKTYGDFTVKKHAGNFDCIITGANTFGAITLETPDATYPYSDIQLPAGATTTCTSLVADGTGSYKIGIASSTHETQATISDGAGTNTVSNCTIHDIAAAGGATWIANSSTDSGGNSGWTFPALSALHSLSPGLTPSPSLSPGFEFWGRPND